MKKSKRSPILEELLNDSPKDIEERVKKLSKMILGEYDENNLNELSVNPTHLKVGGI